MHTCEVIKNTFKEDIATECKGRYCYIGSELSRKFSMADKTLFEEQHDLLYRAVCATNNCSEDYVGETARGIVERATDQNGWDQHSHAFVDFENYLFIVNVISATFWYIFVNNKLVFYLLE